MPWLCEISITWDETSVGASVFKPSTEKKKNSLIYLTITKDQLTFRGYQYTTYDPQDWVMDNMQAYDIKLPVTQK